MDTQRASQGKGISRRRFLGMSAAAAGSTLAAPWAGAASKPNFVFILVDDLGWADTGCYGSTYYETPNIDRMAREGMRFTNGYAACAVCSPTRAAVMTGRYPARLGVTDWIRASWQGSSVPEDRKNPSGYEGGTDRKLLCPKNALWLESEETTIAEALGSAGYVSCHVGKWHLGFDDWYPEKQGFDYNVGGCDYGHPPSYFDPYCNKKGKCIPTLESRKPGEYLTDREADEAVGFIRKHKDQPFFLYLAHYAVHTPIQGKKDVAAKYKKKKPTHQKNPTYAAMVESVDDAVGRVLDTLDECGVAENTCIVFTSDNGGLLGPTSNQPLRSGKGYPYEGGIREPVIMRWPGAIPAGTTCDVPVSSIDYFPTLCEFAGIEAPAGRPIDGLSLAPLAKQSGDIDRDALFWHFPHYRSGDVRPYGIIRRGEWKLIKRYEGPSYELYNLAEDLSEETDLAERMPKLVQELDKRFTAWLGESGAKMPKANPDYAGEKAKS